jgi:ribosomal protein S18 acetylase RimI-like enzyme
VNREVFAIFSEPEARPDEVAIVRDGLHRFNFAATGLTEVSTVSLLVRDADGAIQGGLLGYVWGEWLHITELWLADACRGRGLGGELLDKAELQASRVGARGVFLSTFDFQAPEFYKGRGYEVYGALTGYPPGHTEYHLRKVLRV